MTDKRSSTYVPMSLVDEKSEEVEPNEQDIISVPWEHDNFSLHLDSTFYPVPEKVTSQHVSPQISSPLRHQWRISTVDPEHASKLIDSDVDEQLNNSHQEDMQEHPAANKKPPRLLAKSSAPELTIPSNAFPYSNSSHIFETSSVTDESQMPPSPSVRSRSLVEHVSPLLNSSALNFDDILPSSSSTFSRPPQDSQISVESWRMNTALSTNSSVYGHYPEHQENNYPQDAHSISTYEAQSQPSVSSPHDAHHVKKVRSFTMPKNTDNLVLYSTESSLYNYDLSERPYSHYFNPAYTKSYATRKRSPSLLKKLVKNIKHRFTKN